MKGLVLGAAFGLLVLGAAPSAWAFCSATSCNPGDPAQRCKSDAKSRCVLSGLPLFWPSSCVTFSIQSSAAPKAGIDYDGAKASLERAFDTWANADCDGQAPSLRFALSQPVNCDASEYNTSRRNANILVFRDDEWPYEGGEDALGLTRLRFDPDGNVGELWDADIEVNAVTEPLSVNDPKANEVDLVSLLTHELGHALGLAHSLDEEATMIAGYETGSTSLRSLGDDDIAGVCSIYPPGRKTGTDSCEPRHGFSKLCGAEQPAEPAPVPAEPEPDGSSSSCSSSVGASAQLDGWAQLATSALFGLGLLWRGKRRRHGAPRRSARQS